MIQIFKCLEKLETLLKIIVKLSLKNYTSPTLNIFFFIK